LGSRDGDGQDVELCGKAPEFSDILVSVGTVRRTAQESQVSYILMNWETQSMLTI
jgi:hypothetical protein